MPSGGLQRGYTLVEIILVALIIGVIATVAIPSFPSSSEYKLDLAADQLAEAIRFARDESVRAGTAFGIHTEPAQNRVRVFRADMGTDPPTPVYDVYHPVSKTLYDLDLDARSFTANVDFVGRSLDFRGICTNPAYIVFDGAGTPTCGDPVAVILKQGVLTLTQGHATRDVVLHGYVGRVTIE